MLRLYVFVMEMVRNDLLKDQRGATAIEYGLIAGLISAVLVAVLTATGTSVRGIFVTIEMAVRLAAQ